MADIDGTVPKGQLTQELGHTGLKGARPQEGWLYEEFLPQLRGIEGARVYRAMADNDPIIGAALFAFTMLLRNVAWTVEAADASDASAEAKEWLETVLFKDMTTPFGDVITDVLSFIQYGFAPAEVVYKVRNGPARDPRKSSNYTDATIGVAKIAVRSQETVWRWHFDDYGELLAMEQFIMGRPNAIIARDKLLNFRTTPALNNPEGRSVLRNAYISYLRKNLIEEAEGRAAIRSAGIVKLSIPGKFLDPSASGDEKIVANAWKAMGDKLAQDRMGSILVPSDVDPQTKVPLFSVDYIVADGRRPTDMTAIVERQDKRMLSSMLADFILLGQEAVGSFALSDNKTALFGKACGAFLSTISDQFNRVLIPRLWALNQFAPEAQPRVKAGDLEAVDLDKLGNYILHLSQSGAALFPSPALEEHLLDVANLPTPVQEG